MLDREGRILYVNHVEEGYERDAVIGASAHDIILPDSHSLCPACYEREIAAVGTDDETGPADDDTGPGHEGEAAPKPA